jgi:hypothetical protein
MLLELLKLSIMQGDVSKSIHQWVLGVKGASKVPVTVSADGFASPVLRPFCKDGFTVYRVDGV